MTTLASSSPIAAAGIGGVVQSYQWLWDNQAVSIVYETRGTGSPVLLLPAFSTVSTRAEMRGIAEQLATRFQVFALDWVGFGQSSRLPFQYQPALYQQFLQDFVRAVFNQPVAVIAAGHAAGYVMQLAQQQPPVWSQIVLVAPTWRGPLRVMGLPDPVRNTVREVVRSPFLGQALYKLNTLPAFLRFMYRQHVYTNSTHLTPAFIDRKYQSTQQPGGRFAPAAFVTGTLDPIEHQAELLNFFTSLSVPVMVVIGEQSPSASRAEMEALAELSNVHSNVQVRRLPGSLGLHEEYATEVAEVILPFLIQ